MLPPNGSVIFSIYSVDRAYRLRDPARPCRRLRQQAVLPVAELGSPL